MTTVAPHSVARHRAAIVFNPAKAAEAELRAAVAEAEARHGWAESLWIPNKPKRSKPIARALEAGVELVVVSGGDGSVRRAIAGLLDANIPLAILPTGTGNLLARSLNVPLNNSAAALDIAFSGGLRRLDVIEIEAELQSGRQRREVSVVLSGVGIDAAMIANTRDDLKKRFGWIAYVDGVLRSLSSVELFPVRIAVDGRAERSHRVMAVFIANLVEMPGNILLVPGAAIDDGLLDVIVLQPRGWFDWLFIWRRFSWENSVLRRSEFGSQIADGLKGRRRNQIVHTRGRQVQLWLDSDAQPFQVDGDTAGTVRSLTATVNPSGVRVRVPQHSPGASPR